MQTRPQHQRLKSIQLVDKLTGNTQVQVQLALGAVPQFPPAAAVINIPVQGQVPLKVPQKVGERVVHPQNQSHQSLKVTITEVVVTIHPANLSLHSTKGI
jgi:hypothetical protein